MERLLLTVLSKIIKSRDAGEKLACLEKSEHDCFYKNANI